MNATATTTVYYRRTNRPYAFPAMLPEHVEVSTESHEAGVHDDDWRAATISDDLVDFGSEPTEPTLIADQLVCDVAIRRSMGLSEYGTEDWNYLSPEDLDDTGPGPHANLCDAVEVAFGTDASRMQRIKLRSRLAADYLASHSIDPETGEYC